MLTSHQLASFAEQGFLVVPGLVPPNQIAAAHTVIDSILVDRGPDGLPSGPWFSFERGEDQPELMDLARTGEVLAVAEELTGAGTLMVRPQPQVALNFPVWPHRPGGPHLDGASLEANGLPGTFTMLVGILLTDQSRDDMGNLWVWPGSHLAHQEFFRAHGPDALFTYHDAHLSITLETPVQVHGRPGDVLFAHYLLGHNIGGNTSSVVRRVVYFRLKHRDHDGRWRECLANAWADYAPVRSL